MENEKTRKEEIILSNMKQGAIKTITKPKLRSRIRTEEEDNVEFYEKQGGGGTRAYLG